MALEGISSNRSINQYDVASLNSHHIDPAMKLTADNTGLSTLSVIAILGSTLAVATVTNFAAALWFALPLGSLWMYCNVIDDRIDELEDLSKKKIVQISSPNQGVPPVSQQIATAFSNKT